MNKPLIGINALTKTNPEHFEDSVRTVVDSGYDAMELCLSALPLLAGGEIVEPYVAYVADIFARYPLRYTAHIGVGLDLRNREDSELHNTVLRSSIDLCERLGMDRLTLHFESESPDPERETCFLTRTRTGGVCRAQGNLVTDETSRLRITAQVIHMVDALDRENFKMTLDTGHCICPHAISAGTTKPPCANARRMSAMCISTTTPVALNRCGWKTLRCIKPCRWGCAPRWVPGMCICRRCGVTFR